MTLWDGAITPAAFADVEQRFDAWCDAQGVEHYVYGAEIASTGARRWLGQTDTWQRNKPDRFVLFGATPFLVDVKTTTLRNGNTGNISIELRTLWAAEHEQPHWTIYAIWHNETWWYMTPFDVVSNIAFPCCTACWSHARAHNWDALPTKCPNYVGPGSGDPFVVVSMDNAKPLHELRTNRMFR